jgi:hypothetical protein
MSPRHEHFDPELEALREEIFRDVMRQAADRGIEATEHALLGIALVGCDKAPCDVKLAMTPFVQGFKTRKAALAKAKQLQKLERGHLACCCGCRSSKSPRLVFASAKGDDLSLRTAAQKLATDSTR